MTKGMLLAVCCRACACGGATPESAGHSCWAAPTNPAVNELQLKGSSQSGFNRWAKYGWELEND